MNDMTDQKFLDSETLASEASALRSVAQFKDWTRTRLRRVFPHGALGCGYGRLHAGGVAIDGIIAVDYPLAHLRNICNAAGGIDTPILRRWLMTREPQLFDASAPEPDTPPDWLANFRAADMRNAAAHAVYDTQRCMGTYHSFHRIPGRLGASHALQLKELAPILHETMCRLVGPLSPQLQDTSPLARLSPREQEVLAWVGQGKLNNEIAQLLFISEITVKHHLTNIFQKLGVSNRVQLVRIALEEEARMKNSYGLRVL